MARPLRISTKTIVSTIELKDNFASDVTHDELDGTRDLEGNVLDATTAGVAVVRGDDGTGAKEQITHEVEAMVLVGAEEAEARLEALLQRKRELLGE